MVVTIALSKHRLNFKVHIDGTVSVEALHANKVNIQMMAAIAKTIKIVFQNRLMSQEKFEPAILSGVRFLEDRGWKVEIEDSKS